MDASFPSTSTSACSRSLRVTAAGKHPRLLADSARKDHGFNALVIAEPHRVVARAQFGLTVPILGITV